MPRLVGACERQNADLLEARIAVAAHDVLPVAEHLRRRAGGAGEEIHRVEAANERGRAARRAGRDELLLDEQNAAGLLAREVEGKAGTVNTAADDHEVRRPGHVSRHRVILSLTPRS